MFNTLHAEHYFPECDDPPHRTVTAQLMEGVV